MIAYAAAAVALALYAQGFVRLRRRRPDLAPVWRASCFVGGVAVGVGALVSPLDRIAEDGSLTAHMSQHLLLGDVSPLLLAAALTGPLALFVVPQAALRPIARIKALRALVTFVLRPSVSFALWIAAVYAWHVPRFYDAAGASSALHVAEHACFFGAGLLVWMQILDHRRSPGRGAAFAGAVLLAGMPLAEVLIASSPLYSSYPGGAGQLHAALLMMAEQVTTFGTAALLLFRVHAERMATVPVNP